MMIFGAIERSPGIGADIGHSRIATVNGSAALLVDGEPFFYFGGAFFYPRIPPERWRESLLALHDLGVNTIDLYIPWNWHELSDGNFDFDGHSNPRRNLRRLLRLIREQGFQIIVRPGPMARNEWRNGGYPDWLLTRKDYGMPQHDILEGRYPSTATLQNANSDAAAAQWMQNQTHLHYADRWLQAVMHELEPYTNRILAIQVDDDQGAYTDNQTWPAPHFQTYLRWIDGRLRVIAGPSVPTFINTYDMKVPASAPVWAMGNWYGTAYKLGEHERVELDFNTATLTTQEHYPLGFSEFQAGWLAAPEDPQPRRADASNTALALAEALGWGAHGVISFPLQDTLAPFGWEAPFSNALYAWDAAIPRDPGYADIPSRRAPYHAFGQLIQNWGPQLAATHRSAEIAIAYGVSAVNEHTIDHTQVASITGRFKELLKSCIQRGITCDAVDLRFASDAKLRSFRVLVVPPLPRPLIPPIFGHLNALRNAGKTIVDDVPDEHGNGIIALAGREASFGIAANWTDTPWNTGGPTRVDGSTFDVPNFTVAPRSARVITLDLRLAAFVQNVGDRRITTTCLLTHLPNDVIAEPTENDCTVLVRHGAEVQAITLTTTRLHLGSLKQEPVAPALMVPPNPPQTNGVASLAINVRARLDGIRPVPHGNALAYTNESFGSGDTTVVLQNDLLQAIFVPNGGARLVALQRTDVPGIPLAATNATGALRDDALIQPPYSPTDHIARYTHSYPAGTFNRSYATEVLSASGREAVVRFTYDAPDFLPRGARIEKTISLAAGAPRLVVDERVTFPPGNGVSRQRAVTYSALAIAPPTMPTTLDRFGPKPPAPDPEVITSPTAESSVELDAQSGGIAGWLDGGVVAVLWRPGSVEHANWTAYRTNGTLQLVARPGQTLRTTYAVAPLTTLEAARSFFQAERAWLSANSR